MQAGEKAFLEKGEAASTAAESAFDESKKILKGTQYTSLVQKYNVGGTSLLYWTKYYEQYISTCSKDFDRKGVEKAFVNFIILKKVFN